MDSPVDFRIPGRDRLFHSPSAGSSPAGTSPFCLLHTCSSAACLTSTRTSGPSSCAPDDPAIIRIVGMVRKQWHLQRHTFFFFSFTKTQTNKDSSPRVTCKTLHLAQFSFVLDKNVLPASPRILPLEPRSSCLHPSCSLSSVTLSSACSYLLR